MAKSNIFLYLVLAAAAVSQINNPHAFATIFVLTCIVAIFKSKDYINIVALLLIILTIRSLELLLLPQIIETNNNYAIFSALVVSDLLALTLITLRLPICRLVEEKLTGSYDREKYQITSADLLLGLIYILYFLTDFLSLAENGLRHLDDFGFNKSEWLYLNARFFWNNFEVLKHTVNMFEFLVIEATLFNYLRSNKLAHS